MRTSSAFVFTALVGSGLLLAGSASAVRPTHDAAGEDLVVHGGQSPRLHPRVRWSVPANHPAWRAFEAAVGGSWQVVWDTDTGVPLRIFGSGLDAPDSVASAPAALALSRALLESQVALFAPGAQASDFVVVANVLSRGVRTVGFQQTRHGLAVDGGQVSFRFKHDRLVAIGSEAFPHLDTAKLQAAISESQAVLAAQKWLQAELGDRGRAERAEAPMVRAIVMEDGRVLAQPVFRVIVHTLKPLGRWAVDINAQTGAPFVRRQTLMFAGGQVAYRVPVRRPGAEMEDLPARLAEAQVGGQGTRLDDQGGLTWADSSTVTVQVGVVGGGAEVSNDAGARAVTQLTVADGGTAVWDANDDEFVAAQVNAFIAGYAAREYVRGIAPALRFLNDPVMATVNVADECNAYSDGVGIFFFRSSNMCENTGRLPDVVHHEYGHSVHAHAIIQGAGSFDGALSEGISDYLAATIVNDAGMGRGFFYDNEPLRDLNPLGREWRWPEDQGESHQTGQIIGGALWDLRTVFREKYGEQAGTELVDGFWFSILERASGILAAYPEILIEDDDDGDLSNGTPNLCEITEVFRRAGLTDGAQAGLAIGEVSLDRWQVRLPVSAEGLCPGLNFSEATMSWGLRGHPEVGGEVAMVYVSGLAAADIPPQPEGEVLLYKVVVKLTNGEQMAFPNNRADPMYESFIGQVRPIFCTDFEADPIETGWVSELLPSDSRRPRNEWEWGAPEGASGDPSAAYSGTRVIGNDLTGNGSYQGLKAEQLTSPVIDTTGLSNVRLQYRRWLNVQDGDADQAEIYVGTQPMWKNLASGTGTVHHEDREWRMHDLDITDAVAALGGQAQVTFRINSDRFFGFGGWTIDDFCLVTWDGPVAACGDGQLDYGEACDDGNLDGQDGCEADCTLTPPAACGDGRLDPGEQCDDGNRVEADGCELDCTLTQATLEPTPKPLESGGCRCLGPVQTGGLWLLALAGLAFVRRRR